MLLDFAIVQNEKNFGKEYKNFSGACHKFSAVNYKTYLSAVQLFFALQYKVKSRHALLCLNMIWLLAHGAK